MVKTKEKIIMACEELAMRKGRGFYNLFMEELAQEAGVSKRTIYRYFESKEDLIEATIKNVMEKILTQNIEILRSGKDLRTITSGIVKNVAYLANQQSLSDLSTNYPMLWKKIEEFRQNKIDLLMEHLFNNSQVKMRWRVDPRIFKPSLTAAMTKVLSPGFILDSGMSFEDVAYNFLDMFLFGAVEPIDHNN